jgi:hypothetical protein
MNKIVTKRKSTITRKLIAPCGTNCGLCSAYLRDKNRCAGCNGADKDKRPSCVQCRIKNCPHKKGKAAAFCFECKLYPCARLKHLDERYRTKYRMSMMANQESIRDGGLDRFVKDEKSKWACPRCNGIICVHMGSCVNCGQMVIRAAKYHPRKVKKIVVN